MDYKSIYDQFIDDRRLKESALLASGDYNERHHIVPRSHGGDDSPDNLICLTPEDHYFAHLLLAKLHGGGMWSCLFLLDSRRRKMGLPGKPRTVYGGARRAWSLIERQQEGLRGAENGMFKADPLDWYNLDTKHTVTAPLWEMWNVYGGSRGQWTMVAKGERSLFGWVLAEHQSKKRGYKGKAFEFVNDDGRTFEGTQKEFAEFTGSSLATASRVCRHGDVTLTGWRLATTEARNPGYPRGTGRPARLGSGRTFVLEKDGVEVSGKRKELAEVIGSTPGQLSAGLSLLTRGKAEAYKGYRLVRVIE